MKRCHYIIQKKKKGRNSESKSMSQEEIVCPWKKKYVLNINISVKVNDSALLYLLSHKQSLILRQCNNESVMTRLHSGREFLQEAVTIFTKTCCFTSSDSRPCYKTWPTMQESTFHKFNIQFAFSISFHFFFTYNSIYKYVLGQKSSQWYSAVAGDTKRAMTTCVIITQRKYMPSQM